MSSKIINICIDTSIYRGAGYNFNSRRLSGLQEVSQRVSIRLLLTDPIEKEVTRQIRTMCEDSRVLLQSVLKKTPIVKNVMELKHGLKPADEYVNALHDSVMSDYKGFKSQYTNFVLGYEGIDLSEVVSWREQYKPPFSRNKPIEFYDAFVAQILMHYANENNEEVVVISEDGDWLSYCELHDNFKHYPSISLFSEAQLPDVQGILALKETLRKSDCFRWFVEQAFSSSTFLYSQGWDAYISDVSEIGLSDIDLIVESFAAGSAKVSFSMTVVFRISVEYSTSEIGNVVLEQPIRNDKDVVTADTLSGYVDVEVESSGKLSKVNSVILDDTVYRI